MSNEVKIKLSADGSQIRQELKLIDQEIKGLGDNTVSPKSGTPNSKTPKSNLNPSIKTSENEKVKQEARDKVNTATLREMTLIRKELQKRNHTGAYSGYNGGGGNYTPPPGVPHSNEMPTLPGPNRNDPDNKSGKLDTATVLALFRSLNRIYGSLQTSSKSAQEGASLAFSVYGSTLSYDDYTEARKDASNMGKQYGYDSTTTMNVVDANMSSGAGFTTKEDQSNDMEAILKTSKNLGIDPGSLAAASGYASSIGVTKNGNQERFTNILAQSVVDAGMKGREDEQLKVLENIADILASVDTSVSEQSFTNSLQFYNALVNQDEHLKGQRGSQMVGSLIDFATSDNPTLMNLLGFGTEYTGIQGKQELRREMQSDPIGAVQRAYSNWKSGAGSYLSEEQAKAFFGELLHANTDYTQKEIDDILGSLENGTLSEDINKEYETSEGEQLIEDIDKNRRNDKIYTEELYDVEKQENSDNRGDTWNDIKRPLQNLYNGLPEWAQQGVDVVKNWGLPTVGSIIGSKGIAQAFTNWKTNGTPFSSGTGGNWWKDFWGKGGSNATTNSASSTSSAASSVASGVPNDDIIDLVEGEDGVYRAEGIVKDSADDIINAADDSIPGATSNTASAIENRLVNSTDNFANSVDDALVNAADDVANSIDDGAAAASRALSSSFGNTAKNILGKVGKVAGPALQVGVGAYNFFTSDSDYKKTKSVGQSVGGALGGWAGSVLGPLGGIAGGWAGGELGDAVGASAYDGYQNYGNPLAGDWNIASGLWKKGGKFYQGTKSEQESREAQKKVDEYNKKNDERLKVEYSDDIDKFRNNLIQSKAEDGSVDLSWLEGQDSSKVSMLLNQTLGRGNWKEQEHLLAAGDTSYKWSKSDIENLEKQLQKDPSKLTNLESLDKIERDSDDINEKLSALNETADSLKTFLMNRYGVSDEVADTYMTNNIDKIKYKTGQDWWNPLSWFNDSGKKYKSHAVGNNYVPYDNYTALLHRGEMVLTASDADDYRQGKTPGRETSTSQELSININLNGSVSGMTPENQDRIVSAVVAKISSSGLQNTISNGFVRTQNY